MSSIKQCATSETKAGNWETNLRVGAWPTGNMAKNRLREAAIDTDVLPRDITRQRAYQKLNHIRDILGVPNSRQWNDTFPRFLDLGVGVHFLSHRCMSHTWGYHIHTNTVRRPLQSERLGQHCQGSFTGAVST